MIGTNVYPDPRSLKDFSSIHLPLCDGGALPPADATDLQLRRVIQFASLYYMMNRALAEVESARETADPAGERKALQEIRRLSRERDALEDQLAQEGFLAEPVMQAEKYVNLLFTWAGKPAPLLCTQRFETEFTLQ